MTLDAPALPWDPLFRESPSLGNGQKGLGSFQAPRFPQVPHCRQTRSGHVSRRTDSPGTKQEDGNAHDAMTQPSAAIGSHPGCGPRARRHRRDQWTRERAILWEQQGNDVLYPFFVWHETLQHHACAHVEADPSLRLPCIRDEPMPTKMAATGWNHRQRGAAQRRAADSYDGCCGLCKIHICSYYPSKLLFSEVCVYYMCSLKYVSMC